MEKLYSSFSKPETKRKLIVFLLTFLPGLLIYSLLITARLTNTYDGLWWPGYHYASGWEISCGRFIWPFLSRFRAYLCQDPYMSVISLLIISLALLIFDETLSIEKPWQAVLTNIMFMANVVVCVFLSYRFSSPTFAFSFLFSVLAVRFLFTLKRFWNVIAAGICMMLCMGLYQANIGCTCVLILTVLILSVLRGETGRDILKKLLNSVLAAVIGGVLYIVCLNIILKITHLSMTTYMGGDTYSIWGTFTNLPSSFTRAFRSFISYLFNNQYYVTVHSVKYHTMIISSTVFIAGIALFLLFWCIKDLRKGLLSLLFLLLFPIASNAILFVATATENSIQMTAPTALLFPALLTLFLFTAEQITTKTLKLIVTVTTVISGCLFSYLEGLQVYLDQTTMLETTSTTKWMFESTVDDLREADLLNSRVTYIYYGRPFGNSLFQMTEVTGHANAYAKVGDFGTSSYSWNGVNNSFTGVNINIANEETYERVLSDPALMEEIEQMPVFPEKGYIRTVGDFVIVKVSE